MKGGAEKKERLASLVGCLDPLVKIQIAELLGWILRDRHLVVVEDHPLAVLEDVAHVMANLGRGAHVRDERHQFVLCKQRGGKRNFKFVQGHST